VVIFRFASSRVSNLHQFTFLSGIFVREQFSEDDGVDRDFLKALPDKDRN
jgi:hypothetical protein